MINGADTRSKREVLLSINQKEIFKSLGIDTESRFIYNPFRLDSTPKCFLEEFSGVIYFHDFTNFFGKTGIDCIELYMYKHSIGLQEALRLISQGNLSKSPIQTLKTIKNEVIFQLETIPLDSDNYFTKHLGLPINFLEAENVVRVQNYWCTKHDDPFLVFNRYHNPRKIETYGYKFGSRVKLYMPYADKGRRFFGNTKGTDIWGMDSLVPSNINPDLKVLKSGKEYMLVKHLGFNALAITTESVRVSSFLQFLTVLSERGYNTQVLFDNDTTGEKVSDSLNMHYLPPNSIVQTQGELLHLLNSNKSDMADVFLEHPSKIEVHKSIIKEYLLR